jgi:methyl-accepting chemotaxis protein
MQIVALLLGWAIVRWLNTQLIEVAGLVNNSFSRLIRLAGELKESSAQLTEVSQNQSKYVQESVHVMGGISSKVEHAADKANQSKRASSTSNEKATSGQRSLEELLQALESVRNGNEQLMDQIQSGNKKVLDLVTVIQSTSSARFIEEQRKRLERSEVVATQCTEVLRQIVTETDSVCTLVQDIARTGQENAEGATEVAKSLAQLDSVSQVNTQAAKKTAMDAEELETEIRQLSQASLSLEKIVRGEDKIAA